MTRKPRSTRVRKEPSSDPAAPTSPQSELEPLRRHPLRPEYSPPARPRPYPTGGGASYREPSKRELEPFHVEELIEEIKCLNPEETRLVREFVMALRPEPVAYPLWEDRPVKRGTNPAKWIQDHHGDLIGTEGARAAIGRRDPKLMQHYAAWISPGRHPEDDLGLDTRQQVDLTGMTAEEILDRKRGQVRASKRRIVCK